MSTSDELKFRVIYALGMVVYAAILGVKSGTILVLGYAIFKQFAC